MARVVRAPIADAMVTLNPPALVLVLIPLLLVDTCLDELARAICADDEDHIHPIGGETRSLASEETCKCDEGRSYQ